MKLVYLASPYSKYPGGREAAYKEVCSKAAELMQQVAIFCPIAHSHSIELEGMNGDIKNGDWWLKQDFAVLKRCDELWVYQMPGWEESYGVTKEIMFALNNLIPIKMIPYVQSSIKVSTPVRNPTPTFTGAQSSFTGVGVKPMDLSPRIGLYDPAPTPKYNWYSDNTGSTASPLDDWTHKVVAQKALDDYHARDL